MHPPSPLLPCLFYWLFGIFRAIFDSSNKITLLILLRINALKVKKSKSLRESLSKSLKIDWKVIFLAQFRLAQDSAWLSSTQLDSAWLSFTQLDSARLSLTQLDSARLSATQRNSAQLSATAQLSGLSSTEEFQNDNENLGMLYWVWWI